MSIVFNNDLVLSVMENLVENSKNKSEEFQAGVNSVRDMFHHLIYAPNKLSDEMKQLALTRYLNNDESKLEEFANFLDLFVLSMEKINRYNTWGYDEPEDCDSDVFQLFKKCLDGVDVTGYDTDFTRRARHISFVLYWTLPNGEEQSNYAEKYHGARNEDDEDDNNISKAYQVILDNIDIEPHFETLMFHIYLERLYSYVNHEKVKEELKKIRV